MAFVLDCSMTMAWVFSDEATVATDALRESLMNDSAAVPVLWAIEVGNVLLVATRRGRIIENDWARIGRDLAALPIDVDSLSLERVLEAALPLASKRGISVYDAMYLELTLRRALPLATLDRKLATACDAAGVETLPAR